MSQIEKLVIQILGIKIHVHKYENKLEIIPTCDKFIWSDFIQIENEPSLSFYSNDNIFQYFQDYINGIRDDKFEISYRYYELDSFCIRIYDRCSVNTNYYPIIFHRLTDIELFKLKFDLLEQYIKSKDEVGYNLFINSSRLNLN